VALKWSIVSQVIFEASQNATMFNVEST